MHCCKGCARRWKHSRRIDWRDAGSGTAKRTRQAISRHLRVLERADLVHSVRAGRENLFEFDPATLVAIKTYINLVSKQWDQTLSRLKAFVER